MIHTLEGSDTVTWLWEDFGGPIQNTQSVSDEQKHTPKAFHELKIFGKFYSKTKN